MVELDAVYLPESSFDQIFDPLYTDFALFTARAPEPEVSAMLLAAFTAFVTCRLLRAHAWGRERSSFAPMMSRERG